MKYILLLISILTNVVSYCILKSVAGKPYSLNWLLQFAGGLLIAGITTFLFTRSLRELRLSIAYPIFCGVSISIILVISSLLFQERVTTVNLFGAAVIIAGIFMVTAA